MVEVTVVCKRCGNKFRVKVFESGEAERNQVPSYQVRCPECGGPVSCV